MPFYDDFYLDVRFCTSCATYVPYLRSPEEAYCFWCGDTVRLISPPDEARFRDELKRARPLPPGWERDEVA